MRYFIICIMLVSALIANDNVYSCYKSNVNDKMVSLSVMSKDIYLNTKTIYGEKFLNIGDETYKYTHRMLNYDMYEGNGEVYYVQRSEEKHIVVYYTEDSSYTTLQCESIL